MAKLSQSAVRLLIEAHAANVVAGVEFYSRYGQPPMETRPVAIENDTHVLEAAQALQDCGLAIVDENEDPSSRDLQPWSVTLSDLGAIWCAWMLGRTHFERFSFPDGRTIDQSLETFLTESLTSGR